MSGHPPLEGVLDQGNEEQHLQCLLLWPVVTQNEREGSSVEADCSLCASERDGTLHMLRYTNDYHQKKLSGRNTVCFSDGKELEKANLHYLL